MIPSIWYEHVACIDINVENIFEWVDLQQDIYSTPKAPQYSWGVCIIYYIGVSKNKGTPKSSILIGFSFINHPFWGTPIFGNTHLYTDIT